MAQLNASACLHECGGVHPQFDAFSFAGVSTSIQSAPSARTIGMELEGLRLVTDNLTVGANHSFADAECGEALVEPAPGTPSVVDGKTPRRQPASSRRPAATCRSTASPCRRRRSARAATFNPAGNWRQVSLLRIVNPGDRTALVTVKGIDGKGALGNGAVEWRLEVTSEQDVLVMGLMQFPAGP